MAHENEEKYMIWDEINDYSHPTRTDTSTQALEGFVATEFVRHRVICDGKRRAAHSFLGEAAHARVL